MFSKKKAFVPRNAQQFFSTLKAVISRFSISPGPCSSKGTLQLNFEGTREYLETVGSLRI